MEKFPHCNLPLFGYVHSNGKEEGKMCLKCHRHYDIKAFHVQKNADYGNHILQKQEEDI